MPLKTKHTELELIALLQNKNEEAFNSLYDNYSPALYGVILKIVYSEEAAQDVLQESFIKIWRNFDKFDRAKGTLFTWLLNVSRNTAIDYNRSKYVKGKNQMVNTYVNIEHKQAENVNHDNIGLQEVITKLKTEYIEVLDIIYFKGYTQEEASKALDIPLGTVKTRARTALQKLRELLKEKTGDH